jgi:hypothetical protein
VRNKTPEVTDSEIHRNALWPLLNGRNLGLWLRPLLLAGKYFVAFCFNAFPFRDITSCL